MLIALSHDKWRNSIFMSTVNILQMAYFKCSYFRLIVLASFYNCLLPVWRYFFNVTWLAAYLKRIPIFIPTLYYLLSGGISIRKSQLLFSIVHIYQSLLKSIGFTRVRHLMALVLLHCVLKLNYLVLIKISMIIKENRSETKII